MILRILAWFDGDKENTLAGTKKVRRKKARSPIKKRKPAARPAKKRKLETAKEEAVQQEEDEVVEEAEPQKSPVKKELLFPKQSEEDSVGEEKVDEIEAGDDEENVEENPPTEPAVEEKVPEVAEDEEEGLEVEDKIFMLAGTFTSMTKIAIAKRLAEAGAKVRTSVTKDTDYVIVEKKGAPNTVAHCKKAEEYGVDVEELDFLRPLFRQE